MLRPLTLRQPVGSAFSVEPEDTIAVKRALERVGHYDPPRDGLTGIVDREMFSGLKAFQRRRGLPANGVAEPDSLTVAMLNEELLLADRGRTRTRSSFTRTSSPPSPANSDKEGGVSPGQTKTAAGEPKPEAPSMKDPRALTQGLPRPDSDTPWMVVDAYGALEFDPKGPERDTVVEKNPLSAAWARIAAELARHETSIRIDDGTFPRGLPWNNAADAFRHALWSYKMAKWIGADLSKQFTDSHEVTAVNEPGERLMDLYNNEIGRRLAADPKNHGRPDHEVVMEALRNGWLRTTTFPVASRGSSAR